MSPEESQLDELAQEIAGRLVPDIDESQIITADEVFAEIDEDEASRSVVLNEDDLLRSDLDDEEEPDDEDLDEDEELDEDELEDEGDMDVPRSVLDPDARDRTLALLGVTRAAGADVTPGHDELHHYWTRDPRGLAKWAKSPHPWTALYRHLIKFVGSERAKRMASQWHKEVFGIWVGEKKGSNPVGPG